MFAGVVPTDHEDEAQGSAETTDGQVQGRGGSGLRGSGARVALPAVSRDAQPVLRPLPVLQRGRVHATDQPRLRNQPGQSFVYLYYSLGDGPTLYCM